MISLIFLGSEVQWQFVHGLYEFAIYGGRVDNPFDLRVMVSYLKQFFDGSVLSSQSRNKRLGALKLPSSTNYRVCFYYLICKAKFILNLDLAHSLNKNQLT